MSETVDNQPEVMFRIDWNDATLEHAFTGILTGFWNGFPDLIITRETRDAINALLAEVGVLNLEEGEEMLGIPDSWEEDGLFFLGGGNFCLTFLVETVD